MKAIVVSIALSLVVGCALQPVGTDSTERSGSVASASSAVRYECYTYIDRKHVLTLPVAPLNADRGLVKVSFHGDSMEAVYERAGLTQLWIFEDSLYVKVDPDLTAAYMDFRGAAEGEKRKPQSVFQCQKKGR